MYIYINTLSFAFFSFLPMNANNNTNANTNNRELAQQVFDIVQSLRVYYGREKDTMKAYMISGGANEKKETTDMTNGLDILVATPDRFLTHYSQGIVQSTYSIYI